VIVAPLSMATAAENSDRTSRLSIDSVEQIDCTRIALSARRKAGKLFHRLQFDLLDSELL